MRWRLAGVGVLIGAVLLVSAPERSRDEGGVSRGGGVAARGDTPNGAWDLWLGIRDGEGCAILRVRLRGSGTSRAPHCGRVPLAETPFQVSARADYADGMGFIFGTALPGISHVLITFEDGTSARVPTKVTEHLDERYFLFVDRDPASCLRTVRAFEGQTARGYAPNPAISGDREICDAGPSPG